MQSAPSIGTSTATSSPNLPQTTSSTSSPHPQSNSVVVTQSAVTHPASQPQLPQSAGPSGKSTRNVSIFRFRSERAQWLALVAIVLTLAALIMAWVYSAQAQKLAEWEAEKDYQLYCMGLKSSSHTVPKDCDAILNLVLPPPPGHNPSFFIQIWRRIRRANIRALKVGVLDTADPPLWLLPLMFTTFFGVFAWVVYDISSSEETEQTGPVSFWGISAMLTPLGLRILFSTCRQMFGSEPGLAKMMFYVCWTAGHAWALYGSREVLGGIYNSVLQIWTLLGLVNGIITDKYSTLWAFISHILALMSAMIFVSKQWLEKTRTCQPGCHIRGPNMRWIVWRLGHYGSQIGGILALRDSLWGCSVLGLRGFWVAANESPEPVLPFTINPLLILYMLCIGSLFFDIFGHLALHRWKSRRRRQRIGFVRGPTYLA